MKASAPTALFSLFVLKLYAAGIGAHGLLIYCEPPGSYVEAFEFNAIEQGTAYSNIIRPDGTTEQYRNAGMIAILDYPPAVVTSDSEASAEDNIKKATALALKYPQFSNRLQNAATKWRTALTAYKEQSKVAQGPAVPDQTGDTYNGNAVTRVEPDGITVMTDSGVEKIPFGSLPEDIQKKYGYDPLKAAAYHDQQNAAQDAIKAQQAQTLQKLHDTQVAAQEADKLKQSELTLVLTVVQTTDNGVLARMPDESSLATADNAISGITGGAILFIQGARKDFSDGDRFKVTVYPDGNFSYTNVLGAATTVPKWVAVQRADTK